MTKGKVSGREIFDIYDLLTAAERPDNNGGTAAYLNNDTLRALKDELDRLYGVEADAIDLLITLGKGEEESGRIYRVEDVEDFDQAAARLVQDTGINDPAYDPFHVIPTPRK